MVNFSFTNSVGVYKYDKGVNAANLTIEDINKANARLFPRRQQLIKDKLLKATSDDLRYKASTLVFARPFFDYAKWNRKTLAKALLARRLRSKQEMKIVNKAAIVAALKKADKDPQFHRFLDLPAEVRNSIYGFALEDTKNKMRVRPATPAISRVNRHIRNETLPLFFRGICMTIVVSAAPTKPNPQRHYHGDHPTHVSDATKKYFAHATKMGWTKDMRHFQWRIQGASFSNSGGFERRWNERYFVKFSNNMQTVKTRSGDEGRKNRLDAVQAGMELIADTEDTSMTKEDFYGMMAFFIANF